MATEPADEPVEAPAATTGWPAGRAARRRTTGPVLSELAEDWLQSKAIGARAADPGNSDRARRADLSRWARAICTVTGRPVIERPANAYDLEEDLLPVALGDLTEETLLQALRSLRSSYEPATVARTLASLRGFCRWLVRRGHLEVDPTGDDDLTVRSGGDGGTNPIHAFSAEEVERLRAAATSPPPKARSAWPARDVAVVGLMAGCGTRASETCALQVRHVDRDLERPLLRVARGTKGGRRRDVPLPRWVDDDLAIYLRERQALAAADVALRADPAAPLFVRRDGRPFDVSVLDRLVRRLAATAGVSMPGDAAAHAFRHHFGVQLAVRGVPVPVIQELMGHRDPRTTSIYMRMTGRLLVDALDDAGWL